MVEVSKNAAGAAASANDAFHVQSCLKTAQESGIHQAEAVKPLKSAVKKQVNFLLEADVVAPIKVVEVVDRDGGQKSEVKHSAPPITVHERLMLKPNEKIERLEKVYWSRKFDMILARLSIRDESRKGKNCGQHRVFPNFKHTIPLEEFKIGTCARCCHFEDYLRNVLKDEIESYKKAKAEGQLVKN